MLLVTMSNGNQLLFKDRSEWLSSPFYKNIDADTKEIAVYDRNAVFNRYKVRLRFLDDELKLVDQEIQQFSTSHRDRMESDGFHNAGLVHHSDVFGYGESWTEALRYAVNEWEQS